jgi:sugar/nucleoside kinase (ribokinase family)
MNENLKNKLSKFINFCRDNNVPQALLKGIPYVGDSINEILYESKDNKQLMEMSEQLFSQQDTIIKALDKLEEEIRVQKFEEKTNSRKQAAKTIVAIGGGNAEYLYISKNPVSLGQKNPISEVRELVGGGGVNFSARLLATGYDVYPILSVGDDRTGRMIQSQLSALAQNACAPDEVLNFIKSQNFIVPGMKTSSSTILIQPANRTIFGHNTEGDINVFNNFLQKRLYDVEQVTGKKPDAIRISHINRFSNSQNIQAEGEIIKKIIRDYQNKSLLFVNLGASQLALELDYWEDTLKRVDVVQLNLHEAKRLFSKNEASTTVSYIIKWFRDRGISAVITLAKFGAVGTFKSGREGIMFAWPLEVKNFVDPTGAGDAFSAGMVSLLCQNKEFVFSDYFSAIDRGRHWASYACTTYGGCGECPSTEDLKRASIATRQDNEQNLGYQSSFEISQDANLGNILRLIDKAYA